MKKIGYLILLLAITAKAFSIDGLLIKTIDYSFREKWYNTVGSSIPAIPTCDKVFKKQYFYSTIVASDYALDNNQNANVEYSIKIMKPDNTIYFSKEHLPVINTKISNKNNLQMSNATTKVCFENNDSFGDYKIEIQIRDLVSGNTKDIISTISLVELPPYDVYKVKDDDEFMNWFEKYYENPRPESALAYYMYYSQSKLSEKESSFLSIFSIFLEIFKNNNFLLPQVMNCYKSQDEKTKVYLLYLLNYSSLGSVDFFTGLEGDEKKTYLQIKDSPLPDIYGEIKDASQLDMVWATFRANGSYQPILKLIQTLDYTKYQGDLDRYKTSNKTDEDRQKAINNAIYNSLVWSLTSNCKQHKLVKEYCDWAIKYENLSNVQRDELAKILKELK